MMQHTAGDDVLRDTINHDLWTLHEHDSRHLSEQFQEWFTPEALDDGALDVTITSPPYADVKPYKGDIDDQIGFGDTYDEYLDELRSIFEYLYQVTAPTGSLWIVVNSFRKGGEFVQLQSDIIDLCENLQQPDVCYECSGELYRDRTDEQLVCPQCGITYNSSADSWQLQDVIIWNKARARPYASKHAFRNVFEYILWFSKGDNPTFDIDSVRIADTEEFEHWWVDWPERYHPHGKVPENIWEMVSPSQGAWGNIDYQHPAPFPPKLVERILRLTTEPGDIVFDPFAGTGTVPAQGTLMDRRAFAFEVSEEYIQSYAGIKSDLEQRWEDLKAEGDTLEQQQQELAQIIWGLRQLVFAKRLYRELDIKGDIAGKPAANTIFVCAEELTPYGQEQVATDIDLIFDSTLAERHVDAAEQQLRPLIEEQPFTGFGLDATVNCWTVDSFLHQADATVSETLRLFLYPAGRHHRYTRTIGLEQWEAAIDTPDSWRAEYASDTYPPLISNISIRINREGNLPSVERGIDDEPPEETGYDYTEEVSSALIETKLTDF
jgi:DNA modification methylase